MSIDNILNDCLNKFSGITSSPENYLSVQNDLSDDARHLTKLLYDFAFEEEKSAKLKKFLPELIIEDFDEEQIWQEIELKNDDKWSSTLSNVSKAVVNKDKLELPVRIPHQPNDEEIDDEEEDASDSDENDLHEDTNETNVSKEEPELPPSNSNKKKRDSKGSIVDDQFFKLKEMEAFLEAEDRAEMLKTKKSNKKGKKNESDEEDDESDVDLFEGWDSEDEDSENDQFKYNDFFDKASGKGGDEENEESPKKLKMQSQNEFDEESDDLNDSEVDLKDIETKKSKKVSFNLPQPSSDESEDNYSENDNENDNQDQQNSETEKPENLSEFQLRQQRLKKKISHLEDNLLQEKAWTMKGEVDASSRPQNSLLEEVVDFDVTSRPAPVITEETTLKLQDIIIQRIKDKSWDDVERKAKPVQEVREFKKQLVLDQEKSKLSLAQVYEQEYVKQREALNPDADEKPEEEPEAHVEIRKLMSKLFLKLDALCNFHYTPKMAVPEVKIVSNMPAITMEEVAPVATSDATLLAPEEIKGKAKGDIIGASERTGTDKKRDRRKKKIRQREREKEKQKRDKLVEKLRPGLGNKYSKEKLSKLLDKVSKDRNVDKMVESGDQKSLTSSTAFFHKLQEEVSNTIKSKMKTTGSKQKKHRTAKQLKL